MKNIVSCTFYFKFNIHDSGLKKLTGNVPGIKCVYLCLCTEAAEKLFDLVDSFAESTKRKAAVWPLQIILLILCPEITHTISKDTVEESKANKV